MHSSQDLIHDTGFTITGLILFSVYFEQDFDKV